MYLFNVEEIMCYSGKITNFLYILYLVQCLHDDLICTAIKFSFNNDILLLFFKIKKHNYY